MTELWIEMQPLLVGQSVAKGVNGMSHQDADAQNEERSYNSRKHV